MSINATLFLQAIVFAILVWFTMKFVWPPIAKALDERTQKIADGLAQADQARYELESAHKKAEAELSTSRNETAVILADAERRAASIIAEAKGKAELEAGRIIESAKVEAQLQVIQLRAALRTDVAKLAVQGAEKILRREINPSAHAELISQLQEEL